MTAVIDRDRYPGNIFPIHLESATEALVSSANNRLKERVSASSTVVWKLVHIGS